MIFYDLGISLSLGFNFDNDFFILSELKPDVHKSAKAFIWRVLSSYWQTLLLKLVD